MSDPKSDAAGSEPAKTFSFAPFAGDRRYTSMQGKEVHEPARRPSASSGSATKAASPPPKASSPPQGSLTGVAAAIAGRRRSSASSQGVGSGMLSTRSGDHIQARRESWEDMKAPGGFGGLFGGFGGGQKK